MDKLFGLDVVDDDRLYARAKAEGHAFEGTGIEAQSDAFGWMAEMSRDSGCWPRCGCDVRCDACHDHRFIRSADGGLAMQIVEHRSGRPLPPEWHRQRHEAIRFGARHNLATPWLFSHPLHYEPPPVDPETGF